MALYCATHRDEDLNALRGERLDSLTEHMVAHKSYSLDALDVLSSRYVVWEMRRGEDGHYYFDEINWR